MSSRVRSAPGVAPDLPSLQDWFWPTRFVGIAFVGLLANTVAMGPMFLAVKYAGAAYLIWRGYRLIVAKDSVVDVETARRGGLWQDISLGLFAILSNSKAILFFGALMPTLIDMTAVAAVDFLVPSAIVAGVSFLFYGVCALLAARARRFRYSDKAARWLRKVTGSIFVGSSVLVATR